MQAFRKSISKIYVSPADKKIHLDFVSIFRTYILNQIGTKSPLFASIDICIRVIFESEDEIKKKLTTKMKKNPYSGSKQKLLDASI